MDSRGNIRELTEEQPVRPDEIVIPEPQLARVEGMNRQQRRAWYRAEQKRLKAAKS